MVVHLVSWYGHLVASVASDWCMSTDFHMLLSVVDMIILSTVIGTISKCSLTLRLNVLLEFHQRNLLIFTAVWTLKHSFVEDVSNDEMQVTLISKHVVARGACVSAFRMFFSRLPAVSASQSLTILALTWKIC